jgi:hypothetical protein
VLTPLQEQVASIIAGSPAESTETDPGVGAGLFPAEPRRPAPTLSGEELAVDQVLAAFGPAEARDFVGLDRFAAWRLSSRRRAPGDFRAGTTVVHDSEEVRP